MTNDGVSRRRFLMESGALAASMIGSARGLAESQRAAGRLIRTLRLGDPNPAGAPPLDQLLGSGLDARLFTDLSTLDAGALITPNDRFYIRTACPDEANARRPWTIALGGRVPRPAMVTLDTLERFVAPMGAHLLECSGNTNANNYGLMSVARWEGMAIGTLLDRATSSSRDTHVRISGMDDVGRAPVTSTPGASWIFSRDDLERTGAFLATRMNGVPLPRHHGAPARLIVPGWYGCTCIKWVNRIDLVDDSVEATSQMQEFAARTHQPRGARLAREFEPAVIDTAALPIRVEQWIIDSRVVYKVVGILWGGSQPTNALQIRFRSGQRWEEVTDCPRPATTATWSLWSHLWRPPEPGRYDIVLRVNDPAIRTRRLDLYAYVRTVEIIET